MQVAGSHQMWSSFFNDLQESEHSRMALLKALTVEGVLEGGLCELCVPLVALHGQVSGEASPVGQRQVRQVSRTRGHRANIPGLSLWASKHLPDHENIIWSQPLSKEASTGKCGSQPCDGTDKCVRWAIQEDTGQTFLDSASEQGSMCPTMKTSQFWWFHEQLFYEITFLMVSLTTC
jgi:hypothetical protein